MQLTTIVEDYVYALMKMAQAEELEDGAIVATVPGAPGVIASGWDVHECSADLYARLEDWVKVRIQRGYRLPAVNGIDLNSPERRALVDHPWTDARNPRGQYYANEDELEAAFTARRQPD
jgi:predicted RNase H-like HicB family nuclease